MRRGGSRLGFWCHVSRESVSSSRGTRFGGVLPESSCGIREVTGSVGCFGELLGFLLLRSALLLITSVPLLCGAEESRRNGLV